MGCKFVLIDLGLGKLFNGLVKTINYNCIQVNGSFTVLQKVKCSVNQTLNLYKGRLIFFGLLNHKGKNEKYPDSNYLTKSARKLLTNPRTTLYIILVHTG
jgi:hypothetical protein